MTECKKCGRCCHIVHEGKVIPCKYLNKNKTCSIFKDGNMTCVGTNPFGIEGWGCLLRTLLNNDFKDCPFNTGKPIREVGY